MSLLEAVILGTVQGLTEFIPISSSGHLVVVPELFGWDHPGLAFDVLLHVASLIALVVYFARDLLGVVGGALRRERPALRLVGLLALGTVPAALAGFLFGDYFEEAFTEGRVAALQLLITAAILVAGELAYRFHVDRASRRDGLREVEDLGVWDALAFGTAQAIAIFPGVSRSGATIAAGLAGAVSRAAAARFSFLLAIPALAGAAALKVPELGASTVGFGAGVAGFVASLVVSYAAIAGLLRYLRNNTLYPFAVYCVIAGVVFYVALG
ncbi:MAG TPA: undecaprenyl-diphosphate phosphatase [Actinomycetota bacterium]|nr:undecaprenyl-diphosphate phosphatase [Actinomycetota bacterium]